MPVLLKVGDDVSTDEIVMAGSKALSLRSNIPAISQYAFFALDETFAVRAQVATENARTLKFESHGFEEE